jgi:type I restriction enzyme S subunit
MSSKPKNTAKKDQTIATFMPKLRFPLFQGAEGWLPSVLADACDMQAGKFVTASNIAEQIDAGMFPCYGGNGLRGYTRTFTHDGTYPLIGRQGALCGNVRLVSGRFHATEHAVVATPKQAIDVGWLRYSLELLNLNRFATGQAQPGLSVDILNNVALAIPSLKAEQRKIADCLSSLDELIAAQAQKVEALKSHKKGLMQQLFPHEGETRPRLRFPEFQGAGEWEMRRVDERGSVLAGKALAVNAPGPLRPYLRTKNVLDGSIDLSDVLRMPMTDAEFSRFEILDGDVLLNEGQSLELVGRASIYRGECRERCAMQNQLLRFRAFPVTCAEFAAQYFRKCQKDGTFANVATKTTSVAHLGSSRFSALELAWPSLSEQHRISFCLSNLDAMITAGILKLEAFKTHKKGLMQQLFPSTEGDEI